MLNASAQINALSSEILDGSPVDAQWETLGYLVEAQDAVREDDLLTARFQLMKAADAAGLRDQFEGAVIYCTRITKL